MGMVLSDDPTKVFGRRVAAAVIDGLVVLGPAIAVASSQVSYADRDTRIELGTILDADDFCDEYVDRTEGVCINVDDTVVYDEGSGAPFLTAFGLAIAMFVLLQGLTGWTLGKRLTGVRLVNAAGAIPGLGAAFVRWLFWIVDGLPFAGLVGFITGLTTVGHRRVGDMVAKTFVVRASAAGQPVSIPGLTQPPAAPTPLGEHAPTAPGAPWPAAPGAAAAPVHAPPVAKPGPQWDEARGTYIQWDPELRLWMHWDDIGKTWSPIENQ